jgi:hypothetical protein
MLMLIRLRHYLMPRLRRHALPPERLILPLSCHAAAALLPFRYERRRASRRFRL